MSDLHRSEQLRVEQQRDLERSRMATERAEIERELERATRLEAVGHLAASVAHDVNNLLGVIKNYASAVTRRGVDDETADDLGGIDRAVARGAELTQRLLRLGRSDSADAESISVRRVLDELRPTLERLFDGSPGIDVDVLLGDDDCTTVASRSGLERAVINLVLNSRDAYSDTGRTGTVVVRLDGPHPSAEPSDGPQEIRVRVSDRAGGIPPQVRDDLLEPFVSTKGERGSGLGLTIVQRVARLHRGRVEINTGDDGTEVQLVLPMIRSVHPSEPAAARTWSVLVVDDDDDLRASACRLLAGFGCTTTEAVDMAEALGQIEQSHHDLVLSDVRMPGGSGVDLLRELRRNGSEVPVVLMTGHPGDLQELGDDLDPVVVQKPFAAMELFAAMTRALT
jgi:nitrogen-specific signal transduction histidine kinase